MRRKIYAEEIAFCMEAREQGFGWRAISFALSVSPSGLRAAICRAKKYGFFSYPMRGSLTVRRVVVAHGVAHEYIYLIGTHDADNETGEIP